METDHIKPVSEGGGNNIENAIPVCFDCHAELHSYNSKHPRGRKYTENELRVHKDQWLTLCKESPASVFLSAVVSDAEVGPLQALFDEIEFNLEVAKYTSNDNVGCPFRDQQFERAIRTGSISILVPELKAAIQQAYVQIGRLNTESVAMANSRAGAGIATYHRTISESNIKECTSAIEYAQSELLKFLGRND